MSFSSRFFRLIVFSAFILTTFTQWMSFDIEAIRTQETVWYLRNTTASSAFGTTGPTSEHSSATDVFSGSPSTKSTALAMTATPGSSQATIATVETTATAGPIWLGTFLSSKLAAQSLPAGSIFRFETSFAESNLNANMILRLHVYVWREGTGYVSSLIDNVGSTNCGAEPVAINSSRSQVCITAGTASSVNLQAGDQIALEVWVNANNTVTTSYTGTLYFDGTEFIGNGTTSHVTTSAQSMLAIDQDLELLSTKDYSTIWYLSDTSSASAFGSTGPTTEYSTGTDGWPAAPASKATARTMDQMPNTGAASLSVTETTSTPINIWMSTFLSPPLAGQTIPSGTHIRYEGGLQENGSLADMFTRLHLYIWREGTGYVSSIADSVTSTDCGGEAGTSGPRSLICIYTTDSGTTIQEGDQIALEIWTSAKNASTSGYSSTLWYGGADFIERGTASYNMTTSIQSNLTFSSTVSLLTSLEVDIVDSNSESVASPSVSLSAAAFSDINQTTTGTLGTSNAKIRVVNWGASNTWTLSLAPTAGSTTTWSNGGSRSYDFNDAGTGLDGGDADDVGGRLSVDPSVGTLSSPFGCLSTTGVSKGSSSSFVEGSVNSISLLVAGGSTAYNCAWDLTGVALSQIIPAYQAGGSYSLPLTLSIL